jgi:hypothetical protein
VVAKPPADELTGMIKANFAVLKGQIVAYHP